MSEGQYDFYQSTIYSTNAVAGNSDANSNFHEHEQAKKKSQKTWQKARTTVGVMQVKDEKDMTIQYYTEKTFLMHMC